MCVIHVANVLSYPMLSKRNQIEQLCLVNIQQLIMLLMPTCTSGGIVLFDAIYFWHCYVLIEKNYTLLLEHLLVVLYVRSETASMYSQWL